MSAFWVTEPVTNLLHRPGATDIAIYPTVVLFTETGFIANGGILSGDDREKVLKYNDRKYTLAHVRKMVEWMKVNCTESASFSERYGSFYFMNERDRVMFRLFFADDTMPFDL
jgi:hypothetical protein